MDIKQAKQALRRTYLAYTERDADGALCIPAIRQRPLLLIGPPGVGKTAILTQLAGELDAGLVAYTMTHHTRQSALGLPLIREKEYGERTYAATEYTMSEILAAVYDRMAQTGQQTGFLFLDEINCVSETLMPAMLQLLQSKQFGTHRLPEGWIIVAAGNPPQYNQSARQFDTATMDRVRLLEIEADYPVWREYAQAKGLHPAILGYLELNPEHFYCLAAHARGREFVTARGWEDLSAVLWSYERRGFPVEDALFGEFLQHEQIAASFAAFYRLFTACRKRLDVQAIVTGACTQAPELRELRFDARLAMVEFLLHALGRELTACREAERLQGSLESFLGALDTEQEPLAAAKRHLEQRKRAAQIRKDCGVLAPEEARAEGRFAGLVQGLLEGADSLGPLQAESAGRRKAAEEERTQLHAKLECAMRFVRETFGPGQELLIFLTQLEALPGGARMMRESTCYQELMTELFPEEAHTSGAH